MGGEGDQSPIVPNNQTSQTSQIKFEEDESPQSPNMKIMQTKFGEESVWNTTLLNQTMESGQG